MHVNRGFDFILFKRLRFYTMSLIIEYQTCHKYYYSMRSSHYLPIEYFVPTELISRENSAVRQYGQKSIHLLYYILKNTLT